MWWTKKEVLEAVTETKEERKKRRNQEDWRRFQYNFRSGIIVAFTELPYYKDGKSELPVREIALEYKGKGSEITIVQTYPVGPGLWRLLRVGQRLAFHWNERSTHIKVIFPTSLTQEEVWAMESLEEYQATYIKRSWEKGDLNVRRQQEESKVGTEREEVREVQSGGTEGEEQGEEGREGGQEGGEVGNVAGEEGSGQ